MYAAAAQRGIDPLTVDACELWQVGGMLTGGESEEEKRRREDAEVFAARIAAAERGEDYEPDPEPFDPGAIRGPLAPAPLMPRPSGPGVN